VIADRNVMASRLLAHQGCDSDLPADLLNFAASDFPFKRPFQKCFKIVLFSLWRRDPVVELQFPTPWRVVLLCFAIQYLEIAM
jgi:hypothetical protein